MSDSFRVAVLRGLSRRPRRIPSRFLYDRRGAELFEEICGLDEYYPTRTECALLDRHSPEVAVLLERRQPRLVEFGGCSPAKARYLLETTRPRAYLPIDICRDALAAYASDIVRERPGLAVQPIHADFMQPFRLPPGEGPVLGFFPGSTIGNMQPEQAVRFLARIRPLLGEGGAMLVGVDMKKSHERLFAAYNDARGVTSAFILNLVERINRELEGDFDLGGFAHSALYNAGRGRMELHIVSRHRQVVHVAGRPYRFRCGESIHAEDSHKYSVEEFQALAKRAGFRPAAAWCDAEKLFCLHFLRPQE